MAHRHPDRTAANLKKPEPQSVKETVSLGVDILGQQSRNLIMEQALEMPNQAQPHAVLSLQHNYGNNEIRRVFDPQSADQPLVSRNGVLTKYVSNEIQRARSGGSPIPGDLGKKMSSQMGDDFSRVRIHTDRSADHLAGRLQANAFTIGNNIFFRQGAYAPHTARGRFTLMHELTHVMQQSSSPAGSGPLKLGPVNDRYEQEANTFAADRTAANRNDSLASALAVQGSIIQREGGASTTTTATAPASVTPPVRRPLPPLPPVPVRRPVTAPSTPVTAPTTPVTAPSNPVTAPVSRTSVSRTPVNPPPSTTTAPQIPAISALPTALHPAPSSPPPSGITASVTPAVPKEALALGMTQALWSALSGEKRGIMQTMLAGRKDVAQQLIYMISSSKWPLDGSDAEIKTAAVIKSIPMVFKIPLQNWNPIPDKYRKALLDLSAKTYIDQLAGMAKSGTWPKKPSGDDILDAAGLERIANVYQIAFQKWNLIPDDERNILDSIPATDTVGAKLLAAAAVLGKWPLDGGTGHLSYTLWVEIKKADPSLTPEIWNGYDTATRTAVVSATTLADRKKILGKAEYKKDKMQGGAEKVQKIFDNPIVDALSGGAGTSSSIAQAAEGENPVVSASIGVGAAGLDTAVQSLVMAGSISRLIRGQRMANRENASRASRALGRKERREGMWGIASSTLGLGGSISSMVSSSSKLHDNDADQESGLSGRADKASGSFAVATGALGMTRGGIGLFKGFRRSSSAGKYVKDASATGDAKILSDIADFTGKNQNRLGKGMESAKSAFTAASGISNIVGGGGGTISAAVFGGLGLLTGIANAVMGKIFEPKEADVNQKVDDLIALWRKPYAPAIQFAKEVLQINEPDLVAWVDEDLDAARDLIKSKLSKY